MRKTSLILAILLFFVFCLSACGDASKDSSPDSTKSQINSQEIDFFSCVQLCGVNGEVDGSGSFYYEADISKLNYDKTNSDLKDFLKSIKCSTDCESGKLHNGDVVTVTLSYSHSEAEALGITLKETSKTYTKSGLVQVLRTPTQDVYDQLYPELDDAVARSYAEENNPTIVTTYWLYAYDNCGDPYIVGLAALFTYDSYGYTEYDIQLVHMNMNNLNLMDRILANHEFWLEYECQSGISQEEANQLAKDAFAIEGICFAEEID